MSCVLLCDWDLMDPRFSPADFKHRKTNMRENQTKHFWSSFVPMERSRHENPFTVRSGRFHVYFTSSDIKPSDVLCVVFNKLQMLIGVKASPPTTVWETQRAVSSSDQTQADGEAVGSSAFRGRGNWTWHKDTNYRQMKVNNSSVCRGVFQPAVRRNQTPRGHFVFSLLSPSGLCGPTD